MKRMARRRPNRRTAFIYTCALIALGVYAIPNLLPELHPGIAGSFSVLWILFAGLALAANLYFLFGADRERSRMLEEIEVYQVEQAEPEARIRQRAVR